MQTPNTTSPSKTLSRGGLPSFSAATAVLLVLSTGCAVTGASSGPAGEGLLQQASETRVRHPLAALQSRPEGGPLPFLDNSDSQDGKRFAAMHTHATGPAEASPTSGIVELPLRRTERRGTQEPPAARPPIAPDLAKEIERLHGAERSETPVEVFISLRRPQESVTSHLRRQIALGNARTVGRLHALAREIKERKSARISTLNQRLTAAVIEAGGEVLYPCRNRHCLTARLPAAAIASLAAEPSVQRVSLIGELEPEANAWDAEERAEVVQVHQFLEDGHDGEQQPGTFRDDIWFAVIEVATFDDEHPAWDKGLPQSWSRAGSRFQCDDGGCTYIYDFPTPDPDDESHPTRVAGLIFADLTNGQDQDLQNAHRYSGFARNALGRLFETASTSAWPAAMDTVGGFAGPYEHVVNLSNGIKFFHDAFDHCNGDDGASAAANELFEDGTLLIKSAGNNSFQPSDPEVCRVSAPGSAIGVFTVGGIKAAGDTASMRSGGIWWAHSAAGSSAGPGEQDLDSGRGRTVVDLVTNAYLKFFPTPNGAYAGALSPAQGTSFAAPQITGAAINFIDYFQAHEFNLEYEPGILFVNLLLMGDREACADLQGNCATTKVDRRFDRRFGAGRAKFRRFDSSGADAPSHYGTGFLCLGQGEAVTVPVNDDQEFSAFDPEVDDLEFVAWWYDRRHELTGTVANFDLRLVEVDVQGHPIQELVTSDDLYDNKERVFHSAVGGMRLGVEIEAVDLFLGDQSWDDPGCPEPGQIMVYFASLAEDAARDDAEGPSWQSPYGIEPESWTW